MQATATTDRRSTAPHPEGQGWTWFLLAITWMMIIGYTLFAGHMLPAKYTYKPGDDVGYYIGLVGGVMMLIMLL